MSGVTKDKVRNLKLEDLGVEVPQDDAESQDDLSEATTLPDDDPILAKVRSAIGLGFAGAILSGPPGTGKSWYALRLALAISGDKDAVSVVQFHSSYQYEDFMEGFVPSSDGGFELQKKIFPLICERAFEQPEITHVLLIDEISRCDVTRVFGEALTYIEMDKREREFTLSSGSIFSIPKNLFVVATMNPWDKGVDELDVALERRFAQIDVMPSSTKLADLLREKGAAEVLVTRLVTFFEAVQSLDDEMVHLGHAYFSACIDEQSAKSIWEMRLLPFFRKACRLDRGLLNEIQKLWAEVFQDEAGTPVATEDEVAAADDQSAS